MSRVETEQDLVAPAWIRALAGALHPVRWILCLAGLLASLVVLAVFRKVFGLPGGEGAPWRLDPVAELARLDGEWVRHHLGTVLFRGSLLAAALSVLWGPLGGWIVRAELLSGRGDGAGGITPTRFVFRRTVSLCTPVVFMVMGAGFMLLPVLFIGLLAHLPFVGPPVVALLGLPLVLVFSLGIAVFLSGVPAFPLLVSALAAEGTDFFGAWSRALSYCLQRPLVLGFSWALCLALACLPWAALGQLPGPEAGGVESLRWPLELAAAALGLSLFWSLQGPIYLTLRRLVDGTPETDLWEGDREQPPPAKAIPAPEDEKAVARPAWAAGVTRHLTEAGEKSRKRTPSAAKGGGASALLGGVFITALILAVGGVALVRLAGDPGWWPAPAAIHAAVEQLARDNPGALAGVLAVTLALTAARLARPVKASARVTVVHSVLGRQLPWPAARAFARRTGLQGLGSILVVAAGVELYLAAELVLLPLLLDGKDLWHEFALVGGLAVFCLGTGAFGVGAAVADRDRADRALGVFFGNSGAVLAPLPVLLVEGALHAALLLGVTLLAWCLVCSGLGLWGGTSVQWVRWGIDGTLLPRDGAASLPAWVAGFWFIILFGVALNHPILRLLAWGSAAYLSARRQDEGASPDRLELTPPERAALEPATDRK